MSGRAPKEIDDEIEEEEEDEEVAGSYQENAYKDRHKRYARRSPARHASVSEDAPKASLPVPRSAEKRKVKKSYTPEPRDFDDDDGVSRVDSLDQRERRSPNREAKMSQQDGAYHGRMYGSGRYKRKVIAASQNASTPPAVIEGGQAGAVAVQGIGDVDVEQQDDENYPGTVVAQAVTTDDLAEQLREEMRSEIRQELRAQMNAQVGYAEVVVDDEVSLPSEKEYNSEKQDELEQEEVTFWKTKWFLVAASVIILAIVGGVVGGVLASSGGGDGSSSGDTDRGTSPTPPTKPPSTIESEPPEPGQPTLPPNSDIPSTNAPSGTDAAPPPTLSPTLIPTLPPTPTPTLPPVQLTEQDLLQGDVSGDRFGNVVHLSRNGNRMAIGANNQNYVQVYENTGSSWEQIGQTVFGSGGSFGSNLDLNADGSVLVVGAAGSDGPGGGVGQAQVFRYNGNSWNQLGQTLEGDSREDWFGWDVALSDDGTTVAVAARLGDPSNGVENEGYVRVYTLQGSSWGQKGGDLIGIQTNGQFGRSVAMSSDGDRIAVGANEAGPQGEGQVKVFDYSGGDWSQIGQDLNGVNFEDWQGTSVALSSDGSILVTAADGHDENGEISGLIRSYQLVGSTWEQRGQNVYGECCRGFFGAGHISMSSDGNAFAVGAQRLNNERGKAYVYVFSGSQWQQVVAVDGDSDGDTFGASAALSGDGSLVAVGAAPNEKLGYVRIYSLSS